jgi:hypothetical protein
LSLFAAPILPWIFPQARAWEMVSRKNCQQIRARQTRDILIELLFEIFPINTIQRICWLPCAQIGNSIMCRRSARLLLASSGSAPNSPPGFGSFAF